MTADRADVTFGRGVLLFGYVSDRERVGERLLTFEKDLEFPDKVIAKGVQTGQAFGSFRRPAAGSGGEDFRTACV